MTSSPPPPPGSLAPEPTGGRSEGLHLTAASDTVATGQAALDDLVALLDLERLELNLFRGVSPPHARGPSRRGSAP